MFHMSLTSVSKEWQMRPSFWHISKDCHCSVGAFWNGTDCFNCPDGVLCAGGTSEPLQVAGKVKEWEKIQTRFWPSRVDSMIQFENQKIADFWVECSVVYRVGSLISHFWPFKYWKMNMQEDDSLECSAMLASADWWCHICQTESTSSSRCCQHSQLGAKELWIIRVTALVVITAHHFGGFPSLIYLSPLFWCVLENLLPDWMSQVCLPSDLRLHRPSPFSAVRLRCQAAEAELFVVSVCGENVCNLHPFSINFYWWNLMVL